jgi:hypothetical protein
MVHVLNDECMMMMMMIIIRKLDHIIELYLKSLSLHPVFGPPFTPYPHFQWYPQENDIICHLRPSCFVKGSPQNELTVVACDDEEMMKTAPKCGTN